MHSFYNSFNSTEFHLEHDNQGGFIAVAHARPNDRGTWTIGFSGNPVDGFSFTIPGYEGCQVVIQFPAALRENGASANFYVEPDGDGGWSAVFLRGVGFWADAYPAKSDGFDSWFVELPARIVAIEGGGV